jgi:mannose-6-phosphate isomerase-like protein (cupin superfamily)
MVSTASGDAHPAIWADNDDGEALWGLGGLLIIKVVGSRERGMPTILEERMVRGCTTPPHRHVHDEETFIVLDGALELWVDGAVRAAPAGTVVFVPGGVPHAWRVASDVARTLVITTPEHEQFYREASEPAPAVRQPPSAGTVDVPTIQRAAARHGVELLGPPWTGAQPELRDG